MKITSRQKKKDAMDADVRRLLLTKQFTQVEIAAQVGCGINRVTDISKEMKAAGELA